MHPEFLGMIKSFGLLLAVSFGAGMWLSVRRARPHGITADTVMDLVFAVLVSSIVGVRAFYVLTHRGEFDPWYRAFFLWDGGLTLYGGIIASTLTVWWLCRRRRLSFLTFADIFAPGLVLGIGITRIGCFLAGCCHGLPSSCALAVHFPAGSPATQVFGDVAVHPSQLYGSAAGFLIFAILLLAERWPGPRGSTFGRFLVLYGVARFVEDRFRYYEPGQVLMFGWSNNQWISLGLVIVGLALLVLVTRRRAGRG